MTGKYSFPSIDEESWIHVWAEARTYPPLPSTLSFPQPAGASDAKLNTAQLPY